MDMCATRRKEKRSAILNFQSKYIYRLELNPLRLILRIRVVVKKKPPSFFITFQNVLKVRI